MRLKSLVAMGLCLVCAASLGGCGFIPMSGPSSVDVRNQQSQTLPFALVKLTPQVIHTLENYEPNVLAGVFTDRSAPASILFGVGDVGSVTIFEATAGGLLDLQADPGSIFLYRQEPSEVAVIARNLWYTPCHV